MPAGFEQQGSIEDNGRGVGGDVFELFEDFAANAGPDDVIELFAGLLLFGGIAEDECREFGAINFTGGVGDLLPKLLDKFLVNARDKQLLVADAVGVNHMQMHTAQGAHNGRLTRTDATHDTDYGAFGRPMDAGGRSNRGQRCGGYEGDDDDCAETERMENGGAFESIRGAASVQVIARYDASDRGGCQIVEGLLERIPGGKSRETAAVAGAAAGCLPCFASDAPVGYSVSPNTPAFYRTLPNTWVP